MGKTLVVMLSCMLFISSPAWGRNAMYFYNLGLENSLANRKIHYFSEALELNPSLTDAYEKRGVLYYFQGKYSEMSEDFQRIVELEPSNSEAHLMLGLAYLKSTDYDKAVESLARAIELNPRLASAYGHRAEAYRLEGEDLASSLEHRFVRRFCIGFQPCQCGWNSLAWTHRDSSTFICAHLPVHLACASQI